MTQAERYAWYSLIAWIAILYFLLTHFTAGFDLFGNSIGLTIVEQSAAKLLWTYITLAVIAIIAESVIAAVIAAPKSDDIEKDERDHAIEARAKLVSYWFMTIALNGIVIHVLLNAAYGHDNVRLTLNLTTLTGVAFALLLVLTLAEIVHRAAVIWNYRRA
jgi:amino acid permease